MESSTTRWLSLSFCRRSSFEQLVVTAAPIKAQPTHDDSNRKVFINIYLLFVKCVLPYIYGVYSLQL